jgi:transposase
VSKKQARRKREQGVRAYSSDLRERVLRAIDAGESRADIIRLFGVSLATIKRYLKQRREQGTVAAKPHPGRPPKKSAPLQAALHKQLEEHDDATLATHCQLWQQQSGEEVSQSTMSRAISKLGWTRKKRRWVPVNVTPKHGLPGKSSSNSSMPISWSSSMSVAPISL